MPDIPKMKVTNLADSMAKVIAAMDAVKSGVSGHVAKEHAEREERYAKLKASRGITGKVQ